MQNEYKNYKKNRLVLHVAVRSLLLFLAKYLSLLLLAQKISNVTDDSPV
jgi:hypothetical protein